MPADKTIPPTACGIYNVDVVDHIHPKIVSDFHTRFAIASTAVQFVFVAATPQVKLWDRCYRPALDQLEATLRAEGGVSRGEVVLLAHHVDGATQIHCPGWSADGTNRISPELAAFALRTTCLSHQEQHEVAVGILQGILGAVELLSEPGAQLYIALVVKAR